MPKTAQMKTGREVDHLRGLALQMGGFAEAILDKAMRSLWSRNAALAAEVVQDDLEIDALDVEIDELVLSVLALRAPVARDLRQVLAIKTMATDLERVGDLARNIAGSTERLVDRSEISPPTMLRALAEESQRVLRGSLQAFADLDVTGARAVIAADDAIDDLEAKVVREAIARIHSDPTTSEQQLAWIFVAKSLERVGDHATNIAEDVVLAAESLNLKHLSKLS